MKFELPEFAQLASKTPKADYCSPIEQDIEIVVLAHSSKPAVSAETLGMLDLPYRIYENEEWEWPEDHPELKEDRSQRPMLRGYALRQYRAWRGHQEICRSAKTEYTMVFEDDMSLEETTSREEVIKHINGARRFISEMGYDAVSFHAREQTPPKSSITLYGREYVELTSEIQLGTGHQYFLKPVAKSFNGKYEDFRFAWHEGCLAYLIGPRGRQKWIDSPHDGMPCDLFLANELRTIVMRNTIFHHDHRHGSLIANTGRIRRKLQDDGTPAAR